MWTDPDEQMEARQGLVMAPQNWGFVNTGTPLSFQAAWSET